MERNYAGFWMRVLGNILDSFVLIIPMALVEYLSFKLAGPANTGYWEYATDINRPIWSSYETVAILLSTILGVLYYGIMTSKYQGTVGKLMLGLRVIGEDGKAISIGRSIGRYFAYIPSSFFMIGYIMVGISSKKQGLHDKICKTYVVYK